jgi:hypothetical protein
MLAVKGQEPGVFGVLKQNYSLFDLLNKSFYNGLIRYDQGLMYFSTPPPPQPHPYPLISSPLDHEQPVPDSIQCINYGMKTDGAPGRIHDHIGSYTAVLSSPPYRIALA